MVTWNPLNKPPLPFSAILSKEKPILIFIILSLIFDKLDHVINPKNCYGRISWKLAYIKIQETIFRSSLKTVTKLSQVHQCSYMLYITWIIFTLLIAGSMTPASMLLRIVPFKTSSPMLQYFKWQQNQLTSDKSRRNNPCKIYQKCTSVGPQ